jgi:hypothetical protein
VGQTQFLTNPKQNAFVLREQYKLMESALGVEKIKFMMKFTTDVFAQTARIKLTTAAARLAHQKWC